MEIILLKDVDKLGKKGDTVSVKNGFGRNYLFPQGFALPATRANKARTELEKKQAAGQRARKKAEADELAQKIAALQLRIGVSVGEKDKLFGSVTAQDVAGALSEKGFSIDKKHIHLPEPIRSLGQHKVDLELGQGVKAHLQVEIVRNAKSGVKS